MSMNAEMVRKAKALIAASQDLGTEYLNEGKTVEAEKVSGVFMALPVSSLARLYDIIKSS